ncbi:hypothetical protein AC96_5200 [Escherichia coli 2-156-04_S4_C2]|nr:hypothetical protein AC96_5200 [Escherichia coli 2-156-04_S4_C2]
MHGAVPRCRVVAHSWVGIPRCAFLISALPRRNAILLWRYYPLQQ